MLWLAAMVSCAVLYAICDGITSSLRDIRTREAGHPYKDFYHACVHVGRAALLVCGIAAVRCPLSPWTVMVVGFVCMYLCDTVWRAVKSEEYFCLALDDRIHISTGWRRLDKILGFHW